MTDHEYMRYALELAKRGVGAVNPNPLVGAVIVKDDEIIGEGWHERFGELHAERNALKNCKKSAKGATLYVTLEPCCHYGKTPPCTEAIIENQIKRVVVGSMDTNPKVAGKGVALLREAGIEVETGILKEECDALNEVFFHYIETKTPFVVMKYAMTMDGKIATASGKSKWITGETARENVQKDRNRYMAIMVGVGTVLTDNPSLTCRIAGGRNPIRIICDTNLRTPLESILVQTAKEVKTIIATASRDMEMRHTYEEKGVFILDVPKKEGHLDLEFLMKELGNHGIDSVLLEGGGTLNFSALQSKIVNKVQAYIAPKIFGGEAAKTPVEGVGIAEVPEHFHLKNPKIRQYGEDFYIESEVEYSCLPE